MIYITYQFGEMTRTVYLEPEDVDDALQHIQRAVDKGQTIHLGSLDEKATSDESKNRRFINARYIILFGKNQ